jgi:hypothetical protein
VRQLGAKNGMLVFSIAAELGDSGDELVLGGYGYSVLSEPQSPSVADLTEYVDLFSDWGWSGPENQRPGWLRDLGHSEETA